MLKLLNAQRQVMPPVTIYTELKVERVLNYDDRTLSFSIPIPAMPAEMKLENYIQTKADEYVIKQININNGNYDITAQLNIDELEGTHFDTFSTTEQTVEQTMNLALAGTGWLCKCDLTKKRTIKKTNTSTWEVIKQIVKTYRVDPIIDSLNKVITFVEKRGSNRGVYFSSQLNLKSVATQAQTTDFYTRIIPVGKDGLTIESVNAGKKYLEDYTYSPKVKTYYWKDERYTVAENLKADAEAKLYDLAHPVTAYSCDVIDLAKLSKKYSVLQYSLGDVVTIIDRYTKIRERQRIVKLTEYPDSPEKNSCELSNVKLSFEQYAQKYEDISSTVDNITTDNGTVDGDAVDSIEATKVLHLDEVIAGSAKFVEVNTQILNVSDLLQAANAKIGTLEVTKLTATEADLKYATIQDLTAATGRIETLETNALTAGSALIHSLTSDVANINTLMFGTASGGSLTTEFSNTVVGLIGDAQIKSAMIQDVTADKITSGKLYTNLVEICSRSGNLDIADNTILIKDDSKVARVQLGKDTGGDYNVYIWDKSGNLMFDALGLTADGIQREIIRNDMVSENANISAKKLDISSLFTEINGSTETIKAGRIYVDADNQTLDIAFKQMSTDVQTATTKADSVYSLAESANTNASSALAQVNTITETVSTQGTQLTALQGQISSKIWQQDIATAITEIEVGGRNLAENTNQGTKGWYWSMQVGGSTMEEIVEDGVKTCKFTRNSTAQQGWSYITYTNIGRNKWEADTEYTLSVDVKASVATEMYPRFVNAGYNGSLIQSNQVINNKTVANKWVRLCWVVKSVSTLPTATDQGTYFNSFNSGIGVTYQFKNLKLEKGNKATDWTPAPEDTDGSIAALEGTTTTLSNQYTSLNQSLTSLTATVNSNTTAISTKADGSTVTTLQNNITALQADLTGFKSTVSESYTTKTEFSNLKVGGRNIFLNTGKEFVNTGTNQTNQTKGFYGLSTNKYNGKEVTVSFDWKVEGDNPTGNFYVQFSSSPWTTFSSIAISSANKSGNYVRTFTIPTNGVMGTMVRMDNFVGTLTISNAKLEEGNKATDWTPAPEDYTTALNSAIEQTSSSILQTVSATYATAESVTASLELKINKTDNDQIVSMINASADIISLKANRFELASTYTTITKDGAITCNSLTSNNATITGGSIKINTLNSEYDFMKIGCSDFHVYITPTECELRNYKYGYSTLQQARGYYVYTRSSTKDSQQACLGIDDTNTGGMLRLLYGGATATLISAGAIETTGNITTNTGNVITDTGNVIASSGFVYANNDGGGTKTCVTATVPVILALDTGGIRVYANGTYQGSVAYS